MLNLAFAGSLKDFGMPEIFQMIGNEKKTGFLSLKRKGEKISILFNSGKVAWFEYPNAKFENILLDVLKKSGRISEKEHSYLLAKWKKKVQKLSTTALSLNLITLAELRSTANFCLLEAMYPLFRWSSGEYTFTQRPLGTAYDLKLVQPVTTQSIVMEAVRQLDEWKRIDSVITSTEMVFGRVAAKENMVVPLCANSCDEGDIGEDVDFSDLFDEGSDELPGEALEVLPDGKIALDDAKMAVYSLLNGRFTLNDIAEVGEICTFDVCKTIVELLDIGVVEKVADKPGGKSRKKEFSFRNLVLSIVFISLMALFSLSHSFVNMLSSFVALPVGTRLELNEIKKSLDVRRKERIRFCIEVYRLRKGALPDGLMDLVDRGLLYIADLTDPWNRPYLYKKNGSGFTITSM